jgi:hypothetical protein
MRKSVSVPLNVKIPPKKIREKFLIIYELEGCQKAVNHLTKYYQVRRMRIFLNGRKVGKSCIAYYLEKSAYFKKESLRKRIVLHELYHHLVDCFSLKLDFQYWIHLEAEQTQGADYSYLRKLPYAVLKLATIYSANIHDEYEDGKFLLIHDEMMLKAINDGLELYKNWVTAHNWWLEEHHEKEDKEHPVLEEVGIIMAWAVSIGNGYCSTSEIKVLLHASNTSRVRDKLDLLVDMKYLEVIAEEFLVKFALDQKLITIEQYGRFKLSSGPSPRIYRVTTLGKEKFG